MATEWFENDGSGVAQHVEDPCMLLVGDYIPDWVKIPEGLEGAGRALRVLSHEAKVCPKCKTAIVRHLKLEESYGVAECRPGCGGFVWYRLPAESEST